MGKTSKRKRSIDVELISRPGSGMRGAPERPDGMSLFLLNKAFHLFLIALFGLAAYSNTFNVPFVFDDVSSIEDNPVIKSLENFISSSKGHDYNPRRFIGYFSFALNHHFGKLDVKGYHIVNLAIHITNALLVYFLVVLTFETPYFNRETLDVKREKSKVKIEDNPSLPPFSKGGMGGFVAVHDSRFTGFIALFSALFFVSHPIQTQAVTYIVQRFASLATMFYLLSIVFYIKGRLSSLSAAKDHPHPNPPPSRGRGVKLSDGDARSRVTIPLIKFPLPWREGSGGGGLNYSSIVSYFLSLVSAVLAMKTKEIAFTLPIVTILYEFMFFGASLKKKMLILIPVLLTLLIIPLSLIGTDRPLEEILSDVEEKARVQAKGSRLVYLFTQLRVITTYIRIIFLPVNQNLDYDYPVYHSLLAPAVFLSFLFLLSILGTAVYLLFKTRETLNVRREKSERQNQEPEYPPSLPFSKGGNLLCPPLAKGEKGGFVHYSRFTIHYSRLVAFGIFWFFITLAVESGIIPIADVIFEHRAYLPSVGAFITIITAVFLLAERLATYRAKSMAQSTQTAKSIEHRAKNKEKSAQNVMRYALCAMLILVLALAGVTYSRNTVWSSARTLWEDAAGKSPGSSRPNFNLGNEYFRLGEYHNAVTMYLKALNAPQKAYIVSDERTKTKVNLAIAYSMLERYAESIEILKNVTELSPDLAEAYGNLGAAYINTGNYREAIDSLRQAIVRKPDFADARYNLALAYHALGDFRSAMEEYRALKEHSPEAASDLLGKIK